MTRRPRDCDDYMLGSPSEHVAAYANIASYRTEDGQYVAVYSHCLAAGRTLYSAPMATRPEARRALWQQLLRAGWRQEIFDGFYKYPGFSVERP